METNEQESNSKPPQKEPIGFSNVFTIGEVIRIPVDAVIQANIQASKSAFAFIREFGFEKGPSKDKLGEPKMLTFSYKYLNGGVEQRMEVQIPVLSLVTLPFLNINRAKFDIGINILNRSKFSDKKKMKTMVMLGPTEGKNNIQRKTSSSETYFNEFSTNMQASIEVESSDFPSGILQMINLFKDATTSDSKDVYQLHTIEDKIQFSGSIIQHTIDVYLTKNGEPVKNVLLASTVVSDTDSDLQHSFSKPIEITKGSQVGHSSLGQAKALTNKKGKVSFTFTSFQVKPLDVEQNGFIYFSTAKASKIAVYYSIKP